MIKDDFEPFEIKKMIKALELLCQTDRRDGDARHILQLLKDADEAGEIVRIVEQEVKNE